MIQRGLAARMRNTDQGDGVGEGGERLRSEVRSSSAAYGDQCAPQHRWKRKGNPVQNVGPRLTVQNPPMVRCRGTA